MRGATVSLFRDVFDLSFSSPSHCLRRSFLAVTTSLWARANLSGGAKGPGAVWAWPRGTGIARGRPAGRPRERALDVVRGISFSRGDFSPGVSDFPENHQSSGCFTMADPCARKRFFSTLRDDQYDTKNYCSFIARSTVYRIDVSHIFCRSICHTSATVAPCCVQLRFSATSYCVYSSYLYVRVHQARNSNR